MDGKGLRGPPRQVVGSSATTKFELRDGKPELFRLPEVDFIDDKAGKPVGIDKLGRRPIAFGNSDGDLRCCNGPPSGPARAGDATSITPTGVREFAYDRDLHVGRLDKGLNEAAARDWTVVSMKEDWKTIYRN